MPTCITIEVYKVPGVIQNSGFGFSMEAGTDHLVNAYLFFACLLPLFASYATCCLPLSPSMDLRDCRKFVLRLNRTVFVCRTLPYGVVIAYQRRSPQMNSLCLLWPLPPPACKPKAAARMETVKCQRLLTTVTSSSLTTRRERQKIGHRMLSIKMDKVGFTVGYQDSVSLVGHAVIE